MKIDSKGPPTGHAVNGHVHMFKGFCRTVTGIPDLHEATCPQSVADGGDRIPLCEAALHLTLNSIPSGISSMPTAL